MSDFPISDEGVEAVAKAIKPPKPGNYPDDVDTVPKARAAIAAFVKAEELYIERSDEWATTRGNSLEIQTIEKGIAKQRLVGPWRKRENPR